MGHSISKQTVVYREDYIPATKNEHKNAEHKRAKREFRLAASTLANEDNENDTYFESGFWS